MTSFFINTFPQNTPRIAEVDDKQCRGGLSSSEDEEDGKSSQHSDEEQEMNEEKKMDEAEIVIGDSKMDEASFEIEIPSEIPKFELESFDTKVNEDVLTRDDAHASIGFKGNDSNSASEKEQEMGDKVSSEVEEGEEQDMPVTMAAFGQDCVQEDAGVVQHLELLKGSATEAKAAAFESDKMGDRIPMEERESDNEDESGDSDEKKNDQKEENVAMQQFTDEPSDDEEESSNRKMEIGADEVVANTEQKQTEVESGEEEEEEERQDMGMAGQTSLEIGSLDGPGEEEGGWPGTSLPLDRDREGVIETDMDLEDDTTDRINPIDAEEVPQDGSIAPFDTSINVEGAGKVDSKELDDSSEEECEGGEQEEKIHPESETEQVLDGQQASADKNEIHADQKEDRSHESESEQEHRETTGMEIQDEQMDAADQTVCSSAAAAAVDKQEVGLSDGVVPQVEVEEVDEAEDDMVNHEERLVENPVPAVMDPELSPASYDGSEVEAASSLQPSKEVMEETKESTVSSGASLEMGEEVDEVAAVTSEPTQAESAEHNLLATKQQADDDDDSSLAKPLIVAAAGSVAAAAAVAAVASTAGHSKEEKKKPAEKTPAAKPKKVEAGKAAGRAAAPRSAPAAKAAVPKTAAPAKPAAPRVPLAARSAAAKPAGGGSKTSTTGARTPASGTKTPGTTSGARTASSGTRTPTLASRTPASNGKSAAPSSRPAGGSMTTRTPISHRPASATTKPNNSTSTPSSRPTTAPSTRTPRPTTVDKSSARLRPSSKARQESINRLSTPRMITPKVVAATSPTSGKTPARPGSATKTGSRPPTRPGSAAASKKPTPGVKGKTNGHTVAITNGHGATNGDLEPER